MQGGGSYACAWVPTTNSQRMRKLVVVLGLRMRSRMRMRLAVRLFSDHLIGALLCPLQHSPPSLSLLPLHPLCSSLSTSTPSFVWPGPFSGRSYLSPAPLRCLYPSLGISLPCSACLAAAVRQLCLTLLYCLLLLLLVSLLLLLLFLLLLHFVGFCGLAKKAKTTQAGKIDTQGSLWFHNEICYAFNKSGGEGRRGRG